MMRSTLTHRRLGVLIALLIVCAGHPGTSAISAQTNASAPLLYLPEGLEAHLWAETPLFYNPTNIDIDHRGRVWVTEAVNYRDFRNKDADTLKHPAGDRVVILEDTDGDGKADKTTVFVQDSDLHAPLGIAVLGNKVFVSSAPSMIVYTDDNGDDIPDSKEVFLTGFGGFDHDHSLHSLIAGPDGLLYFNVGNAGPHQVRDKGGWELRSGSLYNGGTPYNSSNTPGLRSDDGRIWTGGLALRVHPDGTGLRVMAHNFRNAYELALDSFGNMWQNDNDDEVVACRTTWVMENGNAGFFSADGSRTWRADQRPGQDIFTAHWRQEDPGVMPAGARTGAGAPAGIVVYEGDALGERYRGMLLSADAGRNLVFGYRPAVAGAGYDLSDRIDFASSVGESTEDYVWNVLDGDARKWFKPSDVAVGADGAIYIADWHDPIVGGHAMHDNAGQGRIYRITPTGATLRSPRLDLDSTQGQIQALLSPAVNVRNLGFTTLLARGPAVIPDVAHIIDHASNPYHRARAVWLLARLGDEGRRRTEALLDHDDPQMQLTAFRALRTVSTEILPYARRLATARSSAVRREIAVSLRDVPFSASQDLLIQLVDGYDGQDRWYLEALGTALENKEEAVYPLLLARYGDNPLEWDDRMVGLVWRLHPVAAIDALRQRALSGDLTVEQRQQALVALGFIPDRQAAEAMQAIYRAATHPDITSTAEWWLTFRGGNDWAGYYQTDNSRRQQALPENVSAWRQTLLQTDAPLTDREAAAAALARDVDGGRVLIDLAIGKRIPAELMTVVAAHISSNPDLSVRVLAGEYFRGTGSTRTYNMPEILKLNADAARGQQAFSTACTSCHRAGSTGGDIGPDLSSIRNKMDRRTLLDAIVYPDANVAFGYEPWLLTMRDGSTAHGFLQSDGATVTLRTAAGDLITVTARDVVSRERVRTLMPDPATLNLDEQQLADIVEFLYSTRTN